LRATNKGAATATNWRGASEREKTIRRCGRPEIARRTGVRIDGSRVASERVRQRDDRAVVLDEASARDGTYEHALRTQKFDLLSRYEVALGL